MRYVNSNVPYLSNQRRTIKNAIILYLNGMLFLSKWKNTIFKPSGARFGVGRSIYPLTPQNAKFSRFWAYTAKSLNFSQVQTFMQSFPRRYFSPLSVLIIFLFKVSNFSKPPKYLLFGAYSILLVYFNGMVLCQNWHSSLFKFAKNTQIVIIWGKLAFQEVLAPSWMPSSSFYPFYWQGHLSPLPGSCRRWPSRRPDFSDACPPMGHYPSQSLSGSAISCKPNLSWYWWWPYRCSTVTLDADCHL